MESTFCGSFNISIDVSIAKTYKDFTSTLSKFVYNFFENSIATRVYDRSPSCTCPLHVVSSVSITIDIYILDETKDLDGNKNDRAPNSSSQHQF